MEATGSGIRQSPAHDRAPKTKETDDLAIREMILRRLTVTGTQHNGFFVKDVVTKLLLEIEDKATAMMAAEVTLTEFYSSVTGVIAAEATINNRSVSCFSGTFGKSSGAVVAY